VLSDERVEEDVLLFGGEETEDVDFFDEGFGSFVVFVADVSHCLFELFCFD
jgi:hypothetical protein